MTQDNAIEFWFSIGSTYTYMSVMRIRQLCADAGVDVIWKPFSVRAIMQETDNLPFPDSKPDKQKYMWRDLARRAEFHALPLKMPIDYPLKHFDRANRIAVLAELEGWCDRYAMSAYKIWFQEGIPAGTEENIAKCMAALGKSTATILGAIEADEIEMAYQDNTDQARSLGIFGSPNFVIGDELFWGDDRLEEAIVWSGRRKV